MIVVVEVLMIVMSGVMMAHLPAAILVEAAAGVGLVPGAPEGVLPVGAKPPRTPTG